jgi:hypothetical protein
MQPPTDEPRMAPTVFTAAERPDLAERAWAATRDTLPALPIIAGAGTDKTTVLTRRHPWSTRSDISAAAFSVKVSARISSGRARLVTMRCPTRTATCSRIGCGRNPRVWLSRNLL